MSLGSLLLAAAACSIPASFTPSPVVTPTYSTKLQWDVDHRGVDGFRIYADGAMVAEVPCIVRAVDTLDAFGNPISVELYECLGTVVQAPLQRWIDAPAATVVTVSISAYNSGNEGGKSPTLDVCWPQTISFDTTGETGRNW